MISMTGVNIKRFRSILNLEFSIDSVYNLVAICGENNVGKTNTLRAIDLFFNPDNYDITTDRPTLKQAQGGASIDPKITIEFYDSDSNFFYSVSRDFKLYEFNSNNGLSGEKYHKSKTGKTKNNTTKRNLDKKELTSFIDNFEFRYIESININIPKIVEQLTEDIIDVEYKGTRMTESKKALKEAYDNYTSGLQNILNVFSNSITGTFNDFRNNWNISFSVPKSVDTFRDLISDDVEFYVDDKGCTSVEQKGSGLQRLAVILLNFEILKRLKRKKNIIVCVDEPDIYLHEGLQRKLMQFFELQSSSMQVLYTTHSKIFINSYSMKNVILLGSKIYEQYSARKKKNINVSETITIDTNDDNGYEKICTHLGIEKNNYDILDRYNLIVEGGCDKKYLEEFAKYFSIKQPKIISLDGVDNAEKYLNFYDSYYKNNTSIYKPKVKILFDNDAAGRDIYAKIKQKVYKSIDVSFHLIQNFDGSSNTKLTKNNCNHEIEDLLYPEVMCWLVNNLLIRKGLNKVNTEDVAKKILSPAYKNDGILSLLQSEKNNNNLEKGNEISFISSRKATNDIKNGLAGMFNIEGDRQLITIMDVCRSKYPFIERYLKQLFDF